MTMKRRLGKTRGKFLFHWAESTLCDTTIIERSLHCVIQLLLSGVYIVWYNYYWAESTLCDTAIIERSLHCVIQPLLSGVYIVWYNYYWAESTLCDTTIIERSLHCVIQLLLSGVYIVWYNYYWAESTLCDTTIVKLKKCHCFYFYVMCNGKTTSRNAPPTLTARSHGARVPVVWERAAPDGVRVTIFWRGLAVRPCRAGWLAVHLHDQQLPTRRQRLSYTQCW